MLLLRINLPDIADPAHNPLSTRATISGSMCKYPEQCMYKSLYEDLGDIIRYVHPGQNHGKQWCIALPQQMLEQTVK